MQRLEAVDMVCEPCVLAVPEVLHCQWRCSNNYLQEDEEIKCDCNCCFPMEWYAEELIYESLHDL